MGPDGHRPRLHPRRSNGWADGAGADVGGGHWGPYACYALLCLYTCPAQGSPNARDFTTTFVYVHQAPQDKTRRDLLTKPGHVTAHCVGLIRKGVTYRSVHSKRPDPCKCPPPSLMILLFSYYMHCIYVQMTSPSKHPPPTFGPRIPSTHGTYSVHYGSCIH